MDDIFRVPRFELSCTSCEKNCYLMVNAKLEVNQVPNFHFCPKTGKMIDKFRVRFVLYSIIKYGYLFKDTNDKDRRLVSYSYIPKLEDAKDLSVETDMHPDLLESFLNNIQNHTGAFEKEEKDEKS